MSASRNRLYSCALTTAILLSLFAAGQALPSGGVRTAQAAGTVSVSFPAVGGASVFNAQFSTQDVWPNYFPHEPAGTGGTGIYDRLGALNAPFLRVHAGTDGSWGPITGPNNAGGGQSPALPFPTAYVGTGGGSVMSIPAWDFSQMNLLIPSTHDSGSGGTVSYGAATVTDSSKTWQPGLWVNRKVSVGSQSRTVSSNTATTLTLTSSWSTTPSAGTTYAISSVIGSTPILMDVRYLPDVMYGGVCGTNNQNCPVGGGANAPGGIVDQTYAAYAGYMAALVNYYNKGVSPVGAFPSSPPPGAGPIKYWEIYNEPDFAAENPRVPPTIIAPLLAGVTISGVNVSGGTLTPGTTYTYEITATTVPGAETTPSAPIPIVLPAGDNAVRLQFSRAISQTLSKIPPGYRVYGRSATVSYLGFIGRDTATSSCAGGSDCLTWIDAGASTPDGSIHPPGSNSTGYEAPFSPLEYKKMWDVVVPAMKAVDPTIKVIGPVATNTYSISPNSIVPTAITTGPSDNSWQDNRDYVQVLMTSSSKPDIVSFHQYGGFMGTETEQQMLDAIDAPGGGSVSMYQGLQNNILPYTGNTPLIQTETGVNASQMSGTTAYKTAAIKGFGAAWFGHMAARLGTLTPNLQSIFQFQLLESPTLGAVALDNSLGATPGDPYLNYWLMATMNARIPQGSKLLSVSGTPSGMDVVAVAIPPSYTTVEVMVVNRQPAATCCSGLPQSTTVSLSGASSTQTTLWMVDDSTSLPNGPSASSQGTSTSVNVNFANGYGVAFVEFTTGSGPGVGSVVPNSGPAAGGTSVTITGTNLTGATAVMFGGTAAATYSVTDATHIAATSPAGSGTVDVTVTTPSGTSAASSADRFTYFLTCTAGSGPAGMKASSTSQYSLAGSDGASWQEIDAGNLRLACAPTASQSLLLTANADLWTANAGFNQDLGIFVSDNGGPDALLAWKESGGFAGTYSPNAAYVQELFNMTSGHTYVFKLKWKTNKPAGGATIFAGAGGGTFSPTSLLAEAFPTGSAPNVAVSTQQYALANSNGSTWQTIDATNLSTTLSPGANATAVLGANADLWTANAGFNQDLGIFVSDNGGAATLVAWKESGGFAGTFSPNAAFVKATYAMIAGHTYVFSLKWKTNKPASGATIVAGAGASPTFSPTSLVAQAIATGANPYSAVSTSQYSLGSSDGATWQTIDAAINVTVAPGANTNAIIGANADLWTANAGYNQDLGIFVSDNGGADALVAWKESGGFAGTFSPNAAFAQALYPMSSGHTYVFKVKWKTNKPAPGATIYAAAGGPAPFSPTRLTVELTT